MANQVNLRGASGVLYAYEPGSIGAAWSGAAGNYAFAFQAAVEHWHVVYVGEANSLHECLSAHDLWLEAESVGCTHVLVHVNDGGDQARQMEERDLVEGLAPVMNRKHDPMAQTWR
jgi:hypothetical protein